MSTSSPSRWNRKRDGVAGTSSAKACHSVYRTAIKRFEADPHMCAMLAAVCQYTNIVMFGLRVQAILGTAGLPAVC